MTLKKKSWLSVALFILIFGGLLLTATFTDLQVSKILTAQRQNRKKSQNKRTGRNPSIGRACIQSRQGFQGCGKIIVRHRLQTGYAVWR